MNESEINIEHDELANAFVKLYQLMKHLISEDEYNELVAESLLYNTIKSKEEN